MKPLHGEWGLADMENPAKTHILHDVQYSFYVLLFEREEDREPVSTIEILFPLNHAPVVPRQNDLYFRNNVAYVVVRVSHHVGGDKDDESLGRHVINIRAVRGVSIPE